MFMKALPQGPIYSRHSCWPIKSSPFSCSGEEGTLGWTEASGVILNDIFSMETRQVGDKHSP